MTQQPQEVVALVDGYIKSASVCDPAAWIAVRTGAPVKLILVPGRREAADTHDHSGTVALGARTAPLQERDAHRAKPISHCGRAIPEVARATPYKADLTGHTARLRHGDIVEAVAEVEGDDRVIQAGKRGEAAGFAKGHPGANLECIVRASQRPVIVASRAFKPTSKVPVAYDGGLSAINTIEHIAQVPLFQGLAVQVVTIGTATPEVAKALEDAKAVLKATGNDVETSVLPGHPESAVGKVVDEARFDMPVIGAYGHSRKRSLFIGSATTEKIRSCEVPVVPVR